MSISEKIDFVRVKQFLWRGHVKRDFVFKEKHGESFMKKFLLLPLFALTFLLCVSCGADPLKGHWARAEDRSIEIYDFQDGKFTFTTLFLFLNISYRGTYKISKGQITFKITEFLNLGEGEWMPLSAAEEFVNSSNETFSYSYSIEENVLTMDGNAFARLSDNEYSEFLGEDVINLFQK